MPKIFISHAHADKDLVKKFVELILQLGCGVDRNNIFCTSCPDKGIQEGKNFIDELKKHLQATRLVILMLSPNYFNSQFCLGELGATWALDCDIFPIVIPDIEIGKVQGILQVTHMGMIDDKKYLDTLPKNLTINNDIIPTWNDQCDSFLKLLPDLLKGLKKPTTIPYADYEKLQQELAERKKLFDEQQAEVERLLEKIDRLEKAKDKEEVERIKAEFSTESEEEQKFNRLLKASVDALRNLPETVDDVMYQYFAHNEGLYVNFDPILKQTYYKIYKFIEDAENSGYIKNRDDRYILNQSHKVINNTINILQELFSYIVNDVQYSDFGEELQDKLDYPMTDAYENKDFWEKYLQAHFYDIP